MKTIRTPILLALLLGALLPAFNAAAFYDPHLGRWVSRDPIGERGGFNLGALAHNNPVNSTDSLGLFTLSATPQSAANPGPRAGECGEFSWPIVWLIDPHSHPQKGGIIIQYVAVSFHVRDCSGTPLDVKQHTGGVVDPSKWPLWEAWRINPDENITTLAPIDEKWAMPSFGECTKGWLSIIGVATYYDGRDDYPPAGFASNQGFPSGDLPATQQNPNWGHGSAFLGRTLMASWNCCSGRRNTTVLVTSQ